MAYLNKDGAEHLVEKIGESHWDISKVRDAAKKGWITEEEFCIITGMDY